MSCETTTSLPSASAAPNPVLDGYDCATGPETAAGRDPAGGSPVKKPPVRGWPWQRGLCVVGGLLLTGALAVPALRSIAAHDADLYSEPSCQWRPDDDLAPLRRWIEVEHADARWSRWITSICKT